MKRWDYLIAGSLIGLILCLGCGSSGGTPPGPTASSFSITQAGHVVVDVATNVTITALDSGGSPITNYNGTITVSTDTSDVNLIRWALVTGSGAFADGGSGNDSATYTFAAADSGQVILSVQDATAETIKLYAKVGGTTLGTSADLVVSNLPPAPQWFTWWVGDSVVTCNSNNCDEVTRTHENSAGWVGILGIPGTTQDNWAGYLHTSNNKGMDDRVAQGFDKIMIEAERALSRNEIRGLKQWCLAHPDVTVFLWAISYQWHAAYGSYIYRDWTGNYPTPDGYPHRVYFYWDEYQDPPDNLILCFEIYLCHASYLDEMLIANFYDKTVAATGEIRFLNEQYLSFIDEFDLRDHSVGVLGLGGPYFFQPVFGGYTGWDLTDLQREMELFKNTFPLGIGFYSGSPTYAMAGAVQAADTFCQNWISEH